MLLVTYTDRPDGRSHEPSHRRLGVWQEDTIVDVSSLSDKAPRSLLSVVETGNSAVKAIERLLRLPVPYYAKRNIDEVDLHAPFRPGKIVGVGLNYTEHVAESARTLDTANELPQEPVLFCMPSTAVIGPDEPILHNANLTQQMDWECELAVVIGKKAKGVSAEQAMDHVFGYSIVNDISARDLRRAGLWFYSKGQDSYAPFGPGIRIGADIGDPHALDLSLRVNGEEKQKSNTRHMLFTIPELIADISAGITLEPGDVIATGTPAGVGASLTPQQWLQPGDVVEATVEGIGTLRNPVVDAR